MDPIKKLMTMPLEERFQTLRKMVSMNDPKSIIYLTNDWEFQSRINVILCFYLRAVAQDCRGNKLFSEQILLQMASFADGFHDNTEPSDGSHGIVVQTTEMTNEQDNRQVLIPKWFFKTNPGLLQKVEAIYIEKRKLQDQQLGQRSNALRLETDSFVQGKRSAWGAKSKSPGADAFDYFPVNAGFVSDEAGKVSLGSRRQLAKEIIFEITTKMPLPTISFEAENDSIVFTAGSCFATEIHAALKRNGIPCETFRIEEAINSTAANNLLFEAIAKEDMPKEFEELFSRDQFVQRAKHLKKIIKKAKICILTVGVAPVIRYKNDGRLCLSKSFREKFERDIVEMDFSSREENYANILAIREILTSINPEIAIFITLSPVPLIGVPASHSVIERDLLSKSTLRLAIEDARKHENIYYWPSFEVSKWIAPHVDPSVGYNVFGEPDNNSRHVSTWIIECITQAFIETVIAIDRPSQT